MDEFITSIVESVERMTLDPVPFDGVELCEFVEAFPQVSVGDGAAGVLPAVTLPVEEPAFVECVL